jgi:protein-L-isoaspartate(D-aspartate) O-methyltransferase
MCITRKIVLRLEGAWRSAGRTNDDLIYQLKRFKVIQSPEVERAMRTVKRENFCRSPQFAYRDAPQAIGMGQTISAPHIHATALEELRDWLRPGNKALDVGSGSGYLAACMAVMVSPNGRVYGIERVESLLQWSLENVKKSVPKLVEDGTISLQTGDGWKGLPDKGPFDAIHVGAAAEELPQALVDQLKNGGCMIIPLGKEFQELYKIQKDVKGHVSKHKLAEVVFVPLVKE